MKRISYYFKIWLFFAKYSFTAILSQRLSFAIFFTGKILRFGMYFLFLWFLLESNQSLAGFTTSEVLFIFLTFNLVDVFSQFLFREVYRFRGQVVSGGFDLVLTKPVNALFRSLLGGLDIIDLATIPPLLIVVTWLGAQFDPSLLQIIAYILLVINALIIAASFHIAVLALGILTTEIDHLMMMIYRDLGSLGRFPIDIYKEPLRGILTFIIPIGLMVTIPAKTFFGFYDPAWIVVTFLIGGIFFFLSTRFWNFAVNKYTSASS